MTLKHLMYKVAGHGLPFTLLPPRSPMERWRTRAFQARYENLSQSRLFWLCVAATLAYPLTSALSTWRTRVEQRILGNQLSFSEILRMYGMAITRNIPPVEYALYNFSDETKRRASSEYLYWTDTPALTLLNRRRGAENADVQDKAKFATICSNALLPHVETMMVFRAGSAEHERLQQPLSGDVWVKPLVGNGAEGAARWSESENGRWVSSQGIVLDHASFLKRLAMSDCIVQRPVTNHPDLEKMTNGSAAVLRLVTALSRDGVGYLLSAGIALPVGTSDTTRHARGHFLSLDTGTILASGKDDEIGVHPDTGEPTVGRNVPCWSEAKALVLHAHCTAFSRFATLGWDVVISAEGPKLLETNSGWAAIGLQMQYGPLGLGPLGQIVAEELSLAV